MNGDTIDYHLAQIHTKDFTWNLSANFSYNKKKVR